MESRRCLSSLVLTTAHQGCSPGAQAAAVWLRVAMCRTPRVTLWEPVLGLQPQGWTLEVTITGVQTSEHMYVSGDPLSFVTFFLVTTEGWCAGSGFLDASVCSPWGSCIRCSSPPPCWPPPSFRLSLSEVLCAGDSWGDCAEAGGR